MKDKSLYRIIFILCILQILCFLLGSRFLVTYPNIGLALMVLGLALGVQSMMLLLGTRGTYGKDVSKVKELQDGSYQAKIIRMARVGMVILVRGKMYGLPINRMKEPEDMLRLPIDAEFSFDIEHGRIVGWERYGDREIAD